MKIKMLVDAPGSPDGVTVRDYLANAEYDVPSDLADVFVAEGFAAKVEDAPAPKPRKPRADKKSAGPDENK